MDGLDRVERRKSFKERLGLKGMGCCGTTWGLRPSDISVLDDDDDEDGPRQQLELIYVGQTPPVNFSDQDCVVESTAGMNLAAALAAERHYRAAQDSDGSVGGGLSPVGPNTMPSNVTGGTAPGTPMRVSLMRLLEETDDRDGERETGEKDEGGRVGSDSVCCVCMGRNKGAAFIPCGHTFCRVCSRELWLNRGSCPLCNRSIIEILDIF
ncbi:RING/U-box superfamily protein [Actinidia rufa]|uniref:RING/U-box superfamily protein n=1 Tax=Actinidia rufa TaxID=165716 RepID=A0A7J0FX91_9ERIC|nr:RING/U-box superfamily protein [Actinidia rufa]